MDDNNSNDEDIKNAQNKKSDNYNKKTSCK